METPEEFAKRWLRGKPWEEKFLQYSALGLVFAGLVVAIQQSYVYDEPNQLPVPFLLTGIAFFLWKLVIYAEGILVDLEYLQELVKEGQEKAE